MIGLPSDSQLDQQRLGEPGLFAIDPVWGSGSLNDPLQDPWLTGSSEATDQGVLAEIGLYGEGFQISGQVSMGSFERLSDWLAVQSGFMRLSNVVQSLHGRDDGSSGNSSGRLWARLDQIVLVTQRANGQGNRTGAMVVPKTALKVLVVAAGYRLRGSIHVHRNGSIEQFLESVDPQFLPMTDLRVDWLGNPAIASHFPFGLVSRRHIITLMQDESTQGADAGVDQT